MHRFLYFLAVLLLGALPVSALELRGGPFVVRAADNAEDLAQRTLFVLQEALAEFGEALPPGDRPIEVVVATQMDQFAEHAAHYASINVSGIAIAGRDLIVVKAPGLRKTGGDYAGTVRHELVHILLARNTNVDNLPRWLNEGIAMSLANEYYWRSTWAISEMFVRRQLFTYDQVGFFLRDPSDGMEFGDAYAQSLSMTRFLRNRYGDTALWNMVYDMQHERFAVVLERHTGETIPEFFDAWRRSMWWLIFPTIILGSGVFVPGAILVIIAYFRKRHQNRRKLAVWAREEAEEGPAVSSWDEVVESEYDWELENEERADDWKRG